MNSHRIPAVRILVAVSVFISSCSIFSTSPEPEDFISVSGVHLIHRGRPYYFAGTNLWYGCYLGSSGSTGDRPRLERELDMLQSDGVVNLRVLAASELSGLRHTVRPAIQSAPGVVDDSLLQGLDFLLAEMAKRDMHAVLYLGNYWEWSGGFFQYNVWTGRPPVDPDDTTQGWDAFMDFSASFYSNPNAIELYRNYIRILIGRRNTINGRLYRDDPTIMAWQLANEPRPGRLGERGVRNIAAWERWIDETARFLHTLDPHHLVSAGSEGTIGALKSDTLYVDAFKVRSIDYLNLHVWPYNWGWFNPSRWRETLPVAEHNAADYINHHVALARSVGKPIVMEEFGLGRDNGEFLPGTPTDARDAYYARLYRLVEDSAANGSPLAGSNFWAWGGEGKALHEDGMWRVGDPFVGDPPQEAQGLNSVFASDSSTISIIRSHGLAMMQRCNAPLASASSAER
ncbi:MAG TPA: cellulase family glycosylhydrolase [Bacteroidota bacterium]|nr:cellulase family glycosylhydrolase [Bacteroidota bacterium]